MNTKDWKIIRRKYRLWSGIFLFLFVFSFIMTPDKKSEDLIFEKDQIIEKIRYESVKSQNETYEIKIWFKGFKERFKIASADYQNFNHKVFKDEISRADTVSFGYSKNFSENYIYVLQKNRKDYCNLQKSNEHRNKNDWWLRIISGAALLVCLIPSISKTKTSINYGLVCILIVIIVSILLSNFIGCEYIKLKDYK